MKNLKNVIEILSIIETEINDRDGILNEYENIVKCWDFDEWYEWCITTLYGNFEFNKNEILLVSKLLGGLNRCNM